MFLTLQTLTRPFISDQLLTVSLGKPDSGYGMPVRVVGLHRDPTSPRKGGSREEDGLSNLML